MKIELNLDKWGQALRVAVIIAMLIVIQGLVIQRAIGFGWQMAIQTIKPQIERTGEYLPKGDTI